MKLGEMRAWLNISMSCTYTGRYRFREKTTWFLNKVLSLQIEISCHDYDPLKNCYDTIVYWRDATPFDLDNNDVIEWTYVRPIIKPAKPPDPVPDQSMGGRWF